LHNKFLIGQLSDPNIASLKNYFNSFIDLNSLIEWDVDTNILYADKKIIKPLSIFMRYNVFEESTWHKYNNFHLFKNYILANNVKEYNIKHRSSEVEKLYNLHLAKNYNLNIPKTLYGIESKDTDTIVKPIMGGAHASEGNKAIHPAIIQEKIVGINKRLFVIKNKTFCFDIITNALDYRDDNNAIVKLGNMNKETITNSKKLTKKLGLNFCALDFINDNNKDWFLEVNTMPMFCAFNIQTNNELAKTIHEEL
jgi:hypothetical protein|tara:strand:- start:31 stop:789 length:759 start_codon:yes stop_codon:yes gene_type:complete